MLAALGCALIGNAAALIKYSAVQEAPQVVLGQPIQSMRNLFTNRTWTVGFLMATLGFLFNAVALKLAPLSMVKPVLAGGIVLLALMAEWMLGIRPGRKQILALLLAGAGLTLFAITSRHDHVHHSAQGLVWFEVVAGLIVFALLSSRRRSATWLGLSAGILMGAADVAVKQMGMTSFSQWFEGPAFFALLGALAALLISARALQLGEAVGTVALIGVSSNLLSTLAGYLVFQDPLPSSTPQLILHFAALAAVLVALLLVPAPRGKTPGEPSSGSP
jgi:hypothetical protein